MMQHILMVMGSQRENAKLIPLYYAFERMGFPVILCAPSSKNDILEQLLSIFPLEIEAEISMDSLPSDPADKLACLIKEFSRIFRLHKPLYTIIGGDTMIEMAASLASFYEEVPVGHVSSGMKSRDTDQASIDLTQRRFLNLISSHHFASSQAAAASILAHGVHRDMVLNTGNLLVDLLQGVQAKISSQDAIVASEVQEVIAYSTAQGYKRLFVSINNDNYSDQQIKELSIVLKKALDTIPNLAILFNGDSEAILEGSQASLHSHERFYVCPIVHYQDYIYAIGSSDLVLTESSELHEEAVCMQKPVILLKNETEKIETVWASMAFLAGNDYPYVYSLIESLVTQPLITVQKRLYGNGGSAGVIAQFVASRFEPLNIKKTEGRLHFRL